MYDELVKQCRDCIDSLCGECKYEHLQKPGNFVPCMNTLLGEAANAIEELICEVADEHNARLDAEKRQRFMPVTERLPNGEAERYLVASSLTAAGLWVSICYYADNLEEVDKYDFEDEKHGGFYFYDDEYGYREKIGVQYWMPLPEPPEEGK